jgi:hypothetical protein
MTLPGLGSMNVPPFYLIVGGAGLVVGLMAAGLASRGRRESGGAGLAVWIMIPFLLALGGAGVWLLMDMWKFMSRSF